ncbi:MAG TPA: glycosyltransferase family 39 protein [Jatrophihabitantaceae bacterium]|nr:glycosyltransferase family 39 protein [Jatrophihabitantaceae bacterium]
MTGARSFLARLSLVAGVGLILRVAVVLTPWRRDQAPGITDEGFYHLQAKALAAGHWFASPFVWVAQHRTEQSAGHPPLYSIVLAGPAALGLDGPLANRVVTLLIGTALVVAIGFLGREIAGDRVGLAAAAIAALYPHLWISDTAISPESLYCLMLVLGLIAGFRLWREPTFRHALALGAALSLAALTRSEGLLLFPLVALPFVLVARGADWSRRVRLAGAVAGIVLVLAGPWVLRNLLTFEKPTFMATGGGQVVAYGNCDRTYSGEFLGYWHDQCALKHWPPGDESVIGDAFQRKGLDYMEAHAGRVPVVVAARIGRVWDVFRPIQSIRLDSFFERRGLWPSRLGLAAYYVLLVPAIYGVVALRRRKVPISPFVGIVVLVTLTAAGTFGVTRYRAPFDAVLPVLAAVGVDALLARRRAQPAAAAAVPEAPSAAVPAEQVKVPSAQ